MRVFHCDACGGLVYFENTSCLNCGAALAFLPDAIEVKSLDKVDDSHWRSTSGRKYRLCENYTVQNVCNWAVPIEDGEELCVSCRLNSVIPNLEMEGNLERWAKFEAAKRRLNYSLIKLDLPLVSRKLNSKEGLLYEFRADAPGVPALTGHEFGIITINLAEADDDEREKRRLELHEPYRTILGHFRHEIGHYYWDRFFEDKPEVEAFRAIFGDERDDYDEALKRHYNNGVPNNWQESFISTYATSHPWEDWAETWAHYLHMYDTIETATVSGLSLTPANADEPSVRLNSETLKSFSSIMESWFPLTYLLNNLNRGLGHRDAYPFVLSAPVVTKLQFVHDSIRRYASHPTI